MVIVSCSSRVGSHWVPLSAYCPTNKLTAGSPASSSIGDVELNAYAKSELAQGYSTMAGAVYTKGRSEYLPLPQNQIDKMQKDGKSVLTQNPGY